MTDAASETRSVVLERDLAQSPERVWRALTQPALLEDWLMRSDFAPEVGRPFTFSADWGSVSGEVVEADAPHRLVYTWEAMGLASTVTWTLTPQAGGTHLRLEQAGFRADQEQAYQGARFGWTRFLDSLAEVAAR